jgi:hypothetical protein
MSLAEDSKHKRGPLQLLGLETRRTIPTERAVIQLWKRAAQNPRKSIEMNGMKCSIHVDPTGVSTSSSSDVSSKGTNKNTPPGMDNKRHLLEYLQQHCSMDFLRKHGLNSRPETVLRKTNQKKLLQIWQEWNNKNNNVPIEGEEERIEPQGTDSSLDRSLRIFCNDMLQFPNPTNNVKIVAGTLHESCPEFPCFDGSEDPSWSNDASLPSYSVCLFLGAVRDMTFQENEILKQVCTNNKVPCVGIRFGTVPEFTSKILSLLAFHQSNLVLGPAIHRLVSGSKQRQSTSNSLTYVAMQQRSIPPTCLNVICTVNMQSTDVSLELDSRTRVAWGLVRVIVCTLWRSKLASSRVVSKGPNASQSQHRNSLYLVFDDGIVIHLEESKFVAELANQHQAAPSENQILSALVGEIQRQSQTSSVSTHESCWSKKKLSKSLIKSVVENSTTPVSCAIGVERNASFDLIIRFYGQHLKSTVECSHHHGVVGIMDLGDNEGNGKPRRIYRELLSATRKRSIPTLEQSLVRGPCEDREAASIIALQHFCYQNRFLLDSKDSSKASKIVSGKKRKHMS